MNRHRQQGRSQGEQWWQLPPQNVTLLPRIIAVEHHFKQNFKHLLLNYVTFPSEIFYAPKNSVLATCLIDNSHKKQRIIDSRHQKQKAKTKY